MQDSHWTTWGEEIPRPRLLKNHRGGNRKGRPRIPEELKKRYIPTGIPRGRKPGSKNKTVKPKPPKPPKPVRYKHRPPLYEDQPIMDENGNRTKLTLPIATMTSEDYNRELNSRHMGFNRFLQTKSLDSLKIALSRDGSPKATKFLKALIHPKNKDVDIATVAERNGIGFNDLMAVWRNDKLSEAMAVIFNSAPTIAEHTVKDAESTTTCCPRCDGAGMMKINREEEFTWVECIGCGGSGGIRKIGDKPSRQFVFEVTGMVKGGTSATVNVNNNINLSSGVDSVLDEVERIIDITPQPQLESE